MVRTVHRSLRSIAVAGCRPAARILFFCLVTACAPATVRTHPDFAHTPRNLSRPAVALCHLTVYQDPPKGGALLREDWSARVKELLISEVERVLLEKNYRVKPFGPSPGYSRQETEAQALFRAVRKSVDRYALGPRPFPAKAARFTYSIGPVDSMLDQCGADGLVVIHGAYRISQGSQDGYLCIALADPDGTLLWYGVKTARGKTHLLNPAGTKSWVRELLSSFPRAEG